MDDLVRSVFASSRRGNLPVLAPRQGSAHAVDEPVNMRFPRRERIQPVDAAEMEPERPGRFCVFDAKRYYRCTGIEGRCDLIQNLARRIRRSCENNDDDLS